MEYYIEPAEQTPEVQEQLKAITPTSLNPEEITLLDPACGSGHILVEAYDLFKAIYQERGYRAKDIPALILKKNLFGLEIDDRAAQLAAFALMMKARADDRRIFESEAKPNILAFQDSQGMNATDITARPELADQQGGRAPSEYLFEEIEEAKTPLFSKKALARRATFRQADIASLLELFENAKTFGSLIQVPPKLVAKLPEIEKRLDDVLKHGDLTHAPAHVIKPLLQQARLLARQYDAVVANPPYMGSKYYNDDAEGLRDEHYQGCQGGLVRLLHRANLPLPSRNGFVGMITIPNWMFLSSFEGSANAFFDHQTIDTLRSTTGEAVFGSDFGTLQLRLRNDTLPTIIGVFRRLLTIKGSVASNEELEERFSERQTTTYANAEFQQDARQSNCVLGQANVCREVFATFEPLRGSPNHDKDMQLVTTTVSATWHEVIHESIGFGCNREKR